MNCYPALQAIINILYVTDRLIENAGLVNCLLSIRFNDVPGYQVPLA